MENKATVTVTTADGREKTLTADTIIVFTLDDIKKFMGKEKCSTANVMYVGKDISRPVLGKIMGEQVAGLVKKKFASNPFVAAAILEMTTDVLHEKIDELDKEAENMSMSDFLKSMFDAFKNI